MRIQLHIGLDAAASARLQKILDAKRDQLTEKGIRYARTPGARNHTRLFMAVSDPENIDSLRFNRGYGTAEKQAQLREDVAEGLRREVDQHAPEMLILSAHQLGTALASRSELERLRAMLAPLSGDIRIVAHVDEQARMLTRRYAQQVWDGRRRSLNLEIGLTGAADWWQAALDDAPASNPQKNLFTDAQAAPFWLDYARLAQEWDAVFGKGATCLRALDRTVFGSDKLLDEVAQAFEIKKNFGKYEAQPLQAEPAAAWLTRGRQFNHVLLKYLDHENAILPRQTWRRLLGEIKVDGPPIAPGSLAVVSDRFAADNAGLLQRHPALTPQTMTPDTPAPTWQEADPQLGFRATQYLLAFRPRIRQAAKQEMQDRAADLAALNGEAPVEDDTLSGLTEAAQDIMPPLARQNFAKLQGSNLAPHNRLGQVNEEELGTAYTPARPRVLPQGTTGNVIVGCMKNEAPYIGEWIAYHRSIGVDNFLIYTNGCEDGTAEILDRLQDMGVVQHRNNDGWKGKSPQQYALNQALKEPLIRKADWIIHIDVDEFINVRCDNGTLQDFLARVPDATNVAMTWRLFGHNGIQRLEDRFVIDQFDSCAPRYCPKPHTVWGFKTMFRNIGAYAKISCHRPNKLDEAFREQVRWVNGSGADMTDEVARNGWRNSRKSIGYDLLQLNHYALRSAESFLIKRQRGRALHVNRSIGLNYWIRMDWSDFTDITIKRNIPRMTLEYDRLMEDDKLRTLHENGLDWHRAKADELHANPEFAELYRKVLALRLTETERVAYALALDMES
ncbi:glycosyltransferase family 2 protein [Primorskyibacter marinus]|uniref:glycosyltransferase family 2 protein n=1 Tax=Primorskyibacter marinus TaxID=1977320 RepID=UPI000E30A7E6|nr:glycosyltransferase family 2 protein [Primorskyibacter marinus]